MTAESPGFSRGEYVNLYLAAVFGFDMEADKPIRMITELLSHIDGEKLAENIKALFASDAWKELLVVLEKIFGDLVHALF